MSATSSTTLRSGDRGHRVPSTRRSRASVPSRAGAGGAVRRVLALCAQAGLVRVGVIAVDGTKVHANASHHATRDYEQIAAEILAEADAVDRAEDERYGEQRGDELPPEFSTAQGRRGWLREAKRRLDERRAEEARAIPGPRPQRLQEARRRLEVEHHVECAANAAYEAYRARGRMKDVCPTFCVRSDRPRARTRQARLLASARRRDQRTRRQATAPSARRPARQGRLHRRGQVPGRRSRRARRAPALPHPAPPPVAKHQPARALTRRSQTAHEGDGPVPRRGQLPHPRLGRP